MADVGHVVVFKGSARGVCARAQCVAARPRRAPWAVRRPPLTCVSMISEFNIIKRWLHLSPWTSGKNDLTLKAKF